ncbi:beta-1,4-galactosyltransferase 2-like [Cydia pomonella]|uniref:beta-1,4-galactosyltransferase 2-like n=1 Tax=Cydia pomonella TaxID=82600 RepID=UPI002ADDD37B|nr:beta-1,4-galactosyltransferase 2-like [Cydia pomonella]
MAFSTGKILRSYLQKKIKKYTIGSIFSLFVLAVTVNLFSCYGTYNYQHVSGEAIHSVLYKEVISAILNKDRANCTYDDVLQSTHTIHTWDARKTYVDFDAKGIEKGTFTPEHCNPLFSVAILVTYRNRQKQLDIFLPYMHNFLRRQNIHYKIYLIEQQDLKPFNKGLLYNLGARAAIADGFPCLILHDVDLLPLDASNLYACTTQPRHLSASIDKFRFVLIYDWLVGGVLAVRSEQYERLNGFSNKFWGWGAEDDDLNNRMEAQDMKVIRFPPSMSRYAMLRHAQSEMNPARFAQLAANRAQPSAARAQDGLRDARASVRRTDQRLFTLLVVTL